MHNFLGKDEDFPSFSHLYTEAPCSHIYLPFCSVSAQAITDSSGHVSGVSNVASVFPPMASGDLLVGELATASKVSNF